MKNIYIIIYEFNMTSWFENIMESIEMYLKVHHKTFHSSTFLVAEKLLQESIIDLSAFNISFPCHVYNTRHRSFNSYELGSFYTCI